MLEPRPPAPQNLALFGNTVFVGVISQGEVTVGQGGPLSQYECVLIKGEIWRQDGCRVRMEAEMGVRHP